MENEPKVSGHLINPQAVGWDSGVPFSLRNFLEDILQPTSCKMSPTSNSGLSPEFLGFKETFQKFIAQERHIRIWI